MATELDAWFDRLPAVVERNLAKEFASVVDQELVEPIRAVERRGKTGRLAASVRKEAGGDDLTWIVAAGGELTTKAVGTRTYRRQINIGAGEDTQNVPRGNAPVAYDYALAEEYGNSRDPGHPFFWPTIRARWARFRHACENLIADKVGNS